METAAILHLYTVRELILKVSISSHFGQEYHYSSPKSLSTLLVKLL